MGVNQSRKRILQFPANPANHLRGLYVMLVEVSFQYKASHNKIKKCRPFLSLKCITKKKLRVCNTATVGYPIKCQISQVKDV